MFKKLANKWKSFKIKFERNVNIERVLNFTYKYNYVKFKGLTRIEDTDCYIIRKHDYLYFAVKKPKWNKYIGVHRGYYTSMAGGDFPHDIYCTIDDKLKFSFKYKENIPSDIINGLYDELIENADLIEEELERKINEEYYKE